MRQIFYRGKKIDNDVWTYGFYFARLINGAKHSYIKTLDEGFVVDEVIPETVGQYTGIRDDNDIRIFEGDILNVSYDDGTSYITKVQAYGNTLCVDVEGEDYDFTAIDFAVENWRHDGCELRVISNSYDRDKNTDSSIEFLKTVNPFSEYHNF